MPNNILITGEPGSGKSTLLQKLIGRLRHKVGLLTSEISFGGLRVGFSTQVNDGVPIVLAHTRIPTQRKVSKYYVNEEALEGILPEARHFGPEDVLYLDEVGEMQLYSEEFRALVLTYLDAPNRCVSTVSAIFADPLIEEIKAREDVVVFVVTPGTRDWVRAEIEHLLRES